MTSKMRILVKYDRPNENKAKQLLGIYSKLKIRIINIDNVEDGFVLLIDNLKEAEKIFEDSNMKAVSIGNFQPVLPREIACQRTLFIRTSKFILSHSKTEILNELKTQNSELNINEATKIDNHNYLKISVDNSNTADLILKHGILMFKLHIPGSSISKQRFVKITKCNNCFSYEHHTHDCKEPRSLKCTNCFGPHKYKNCRISKNLISCYHCQENHHTFAYICKVQKEIEYKLKKQISEPLSYANVTRQNVEFERRSSAMHRSGGGQPLLPLPPNVPKSTPPPSPHSSHIDTSKPPPPMPPPPFPLHPMTANLMIETMSKTVGVIQFALHNDSSEPNSFLKTYHELCQANNLPILNLGNLRPIVSAQLTPPHSVGVHLENGELNDTSFLSASEESMEDSMIQGNKGPAINASSPINKPALTENNPLNSVSGASINESCNNLSMAASGPLASSPCQTTPSCLPTPHSPPLMPVPTGTGASPPLMPSTYPSPKTTSSIASPSLMPPTNSSPMTLNSTAFPLLMPTTNSSHMTPNQIASPPLMSPTNSSPTTSNPTASLPLIPPTESPNVKPSEDAYRLISPTEPSPQIIRQVDSSQILLKESYVNSPPSQNGDEPKLFLLKKTKSATIPQLIKAHNEGKLAIKHNGKIIRDKDAIHYLINNRFSPLRQSRQMIDNDQLNLILGNGMELS